MTKSTLFMLIIQLTLEEFCNVLKYISQQDRVKRAKLKAHFKSEYKKTHGNLMKNADQALEELINRLMFEFMDNVVTIKDLLCGAWFLVGERDHGHDLRMQKLVFMLWRKRNLLESKLMDGSVWFNLKNAVLYRKMLT